MKSWLVILFLINGEPAVIDGYVARPHDTQEVCEIVALNTLEYLSSIQGQTPPVWKVDCVSARDEYEAAWKAKEGVQ